MSEIPTARVDEVGPGTVLLDVRERDEWDAGHAPGAIHLPATELMARYGEVPADTEVHVICRTGGRSARVAEWLNDVGFDAVNVAGGMAAWVEAGRPIVAEGDREPRVI
ncbi:rhodanese-like domain-containing protein [Kineosporiaceae bacterium SCSIO 59966]|nr:rhodanese-like domain-containing protein [Kineosporiaceae bacterium SCSIO 59966]